MTAATSVMGTLRKAGFEAYLVGGCVRDLLLGREPKDYDVTTNALPETVQALFEKTIAVGAAFGVIVVMVEGEQIEVATYRADGQYSDGRRPDTVAYSQSAKDDVVRRDFTINGLLLHSIGLPYTHDTVDAAVVDYVGGLADLKAKVIRCIGDPNARFGEDTLRMLRAVRFTAQLGFEIEQGTMDAIVANAPFVRFVSRERIAAELFKLVTAPFAVKGLTLLATTGLMRYILPELVGGADFVTTLERFQKFPTTDPLMGMAMLFADAEEAEVESAVASLKLSTEQSEAIVGAVKSQFELHYGVETLAQKKRLARKAGVLPYGVALFEQEAAMGGAVEHRMGLVLEFRSFTAEDIHPAPLITGRHLIELGMEPSPLFTTILNEVETAQLNGEFTTREQALEYAKSDLTDLTGP